MGAVTREHGALRENVVAALRADIIDGRLEPGEPLRTEAMVTDASTAVDVLDATPGKSTTTVAMDFGRITLDEDLVLYLFGTPGQRRFWFMWDDLVRGAIGAIILVDVRRLQDSGRMSLYIASHAGSIRGMADDEARQLIDELTAHATQRQFVHSHRWRVKDLVIWDDRCTMHRGMDFDDQRYARDMRRATVSDVAPTCEQMGLAVAAE